MRRFSVHGLDTSEFLNFSSVHCRDDSTSCSFFEHVKEELKLKDEDMPLEVGPETWGSFRKAFKFGDNPSRDKTIIKIAHVISGSGG